MTTSGVLLQVEQKPIRKDSLRFSKHIQEESLQLAGQGLGPEDVDDVLAVLNAYPEIDRVDLSYNRLGAQGACSFAQKNKSAKKVNLSRNGLGSLGAQYFSENNQVAVSVDLSGNDLGPEGAFYFAKSNKVAVDVNLTYNQLGSAGVSQFVLWNTAATTVDFSRNDVTDEGVRYFSALNEVVKVVSFKSNLISPAGAFALIENKALVNWALDGNENILPEHHWQLKKKWKGRQRELQREEKPLNWERPLQSAFLIHSRGWERSACVSFSQQKQGLSATRIKTESEFALSKVGGQPIQSSLTDESPAEVFGPLTCRVL